MAILLKPNGTETQVMPIVPRRGFQLQELYDLVECTTVQAITLSDGRTMWMDEEGKFAQVHVVNKKAMALLLEAGGMPDDYVVGTVLITNKGEVK